jgi:hypothetical protein
LVGSTTVAFCQFGQYLSYNQRVSSFAERFCLFVCNTRISRRSLRPAAGIQLVSRLFFLGAVTDNPAQTMDSFFIIDAPLALFRKFRRGPVSGNPRTAMPQLDWLRKSRPPSHLRLSASIGGQTNLFTPPHHAMPALTRNGFVFSSPPLRKTQIPKNRDICHRALPACVHLRPNEFIHTFSPPARPFSPDGFVFSSPPLQPKRKSQKIETSVTARRPPAFICGPTNLSMPSHHLLAPSAWMGSFFQVRRSGPNANPKKSTICHRLSKAVTLPHTSSWKKEHPLRMYGVE